MSPFPVVYEPELNVNLSDHRGHYPDSFLRIMPKNSYF